MNQPKCAFLSFGEVNSPDDVIRGKADAAAKVLTQSGLDLLCAPFVKDDPQGEDIQKALDFLAGKQFDCLIICVTGWIPTHAVIDVIHPYRHLPMILWGLSGTYEGKRLVTTADQAGTSAMRMVFDQMGYCFRYVYNTPAKMDGLAKVVRFAKAAQAAVKLHRARIGMMGYRDMKLYGTLYDQISLRRVVGPDIETFETLEIEQRAAKVTDQEIQEVIDTLITGHWTFTNEVNEQVLRRGCAYYVALRNLSRERRFEGISLIDVDGMKKLLAFPPAMLFMLLADEPGLCTVPENDALGAVTQLMARYLTDQISAYMEFYEYFDDGVLIGVPDFVPSEVVDGEVLTMFAGFGDISSGLMNVSKVRKGRVTLFRLAYLDGRYCMHIVTGEASDPGSWEEAGWGQPAPQLPGLRVTLDGSTEDFAQNIMSQHYIVTYGDNAEAMKDLCHILGIDLV